MKTVDALTVTLSVMGGMSWGLYGINNMDPVEILEGWKGASLTSALSFVCACVWPSPRKGAKRAPNESFSMRSISLRGPRSEFMS